MGLNQFDQDLGAPIIYLAVRDALIHAGVDQSSHPYTALNAASRDVWEDAWTRLVNELEQRGYVFGRWATLKAMIEGEPTAAMWKAALKPVDSLHSDESEDATEDDSE